MAIYFGAHNGPSTNNESNGIPSKFILNSRNVYMLVYFIVIKWKISAINWMVSEREIEKDRQHPFVEEVNGQYVDCKPTLLLIFHGWECALYGCACDKMAKILYRDSSNRPVASQMKTSRISRIHHFWRLLFRAALVGLEYFSKVLAKAFSHKKSTETHWIEVKENNNTHVVNFTRHVLCAGEWVGGW